MTTEVVNIRCSEYDVYIGREGKGQDGYFGNPFRLRNGEQTRIYKNNTQSKMNNLEHQQKLNELVTNKVHRMIDNNASLIGDDFVECFFTWLNEFIQKLHEYEVLRIKRDA